MDEPLQTISLAWVRGWGHIAQPRAAARMVRVYGPSVHLATGNQPASVKPYADRGQSSRGAQYGNRTALARLRRANHKSERDVMEFSSVVIVGGGPAGPPHCRSTSPTGRAAHAEVATTEGGGDGARDRLSREKATGDRRAHLRSLGALVMDPKGKGMAALLPTGGASNRGALEAEVHEDTRSAHPEAGSSSITPPPLRTPGTLASASTRFVRWLGVKSRSRRNPRSSGLPGAHRTSCARGTLVKGAAIKDAGIDKTRQEKGQFDGWRNPGGQAHRVGRGQARFVEEAKRSPTRNSTARTRRRTPLA